MRERGRGRERDIESKMGGERESTQETQREMGEWVMEREEAR